VVTPQPQPVSVSAGAIEPGSRGGGLVELPPRINLADGFANARGINDARQPRQCLSAMAAVPPSMGLS